MCFFMFYKKTNNNEKYIKKRLCTKTLEVDVIHRVVILINGILVLFSYFQNKKNGNTFLIKNLFHKNKR